MIFILKILSPLKIKYFQWLYFKFYKFFLFLMNYWWWSDYWQSWEEFVLQYILQQEKGKITVFDVWANVWWYYNMCLNTIWINHLKEVHCFEPSKATFNQLKKNIINHNDIVYLNNFWLWDTKCKLTLFSDKNDSWWASLYNRDLSHINVSSNIHEEVEILTIDSYVKENNIDYVTLLKLDIEWYELLALQWGINSVKSLKIKYIQFEFWGTGIDARIYFKDFWNLLSHQYNFYRILPKDLYHIKKYEELLEIFSCVNFLCILK